MGSSCSSTVRSATEAPQETENQKRPMAPQPGVSAAPAVAGKQTSPEVLRVFGVSDSPLRCNNFSIIGTVPGQGGAGYVELWPSVEQLLCMLRVTGYMLGAVGSKNHTWRTLLSCGLCTICAPVGVATR